MQFLTNTQFPFMKYRKATIWFSVILLLVAVGELFFYDRQFEQAEAHFAAAGDGGLTSAYNNLGVVLFKQAKFEAAKDAFEKCLERDPGHKGAHSNLQKAVERLSS